MLRVILSSILAATLTLAIFGQALALVPVLTQTTATYRVTLTVGPLATMLTPDQAKTAKSGEVMVAMMGMPMPAMSMTDQGQPVNHHLEVQIFNKATGAVVSDQVPTITTTDSAGKGRPLSLVVLMYDVAIGQSDLHFGNNVYLSDAPYRITVELGGERAVFNGMLASSAPAGTAMPMTAAAAPAMPAASAPVTGLPKTGGVPPEAAALAGLTFIGVGVVVRRLRSQQIAH